jgi:hypothetical protein
MEVVVAYLKALSQHFFPNLGETTNCRIQKTIFRRRRMPFSGMLRRVALVRTDVTRRRVPPKRQFLQEPHGVTSLKPAFFIATAGKTSSLTYFDGSYNH